VGPALTTGTERDWGSQGTTISAWDDHSSTGATCGNDMVAVDGARTPIRALSGKDCLVPDTAWRPSGLELLALHDGWLIAAAPDGSTRRIAPIQDPDARIAGATWNSVLIETQGNVGIVDADGTMSLTMPGTLAIAR
jgi:hypothetical protein